MLLSVVVAGADFHHTLRLFLFSALGIEFAWAGLERWLKIRRKPLPMIARVGGVIGTGVIIATTALLYVP